MEGYQEKTSSVTVPKNTGVEGFLKTLRGILNLRNVQSINIDARGKVSYTRYVRDGEQHDPIEIDYEGLEPWNIIRNAELEEVQLHPDSSATNVIAVLFNRLTRDGLVPVAFVLGAESYFWKWHERTAGVDLARTSMAYGLPIYTDRQIPDHSLILGAAYVRGDLASCHKFLMFSMPDFGHRPPLTSVTIL